MAGQHQFWMEIFIYYAYTFCWLKSNNHFYTNTTITKICAFAGRESRMTLLTTVLFLHWSCHLYTFSRLNISDLSKAVARGRHLGCSILLLKFLRYIFSKKKKRNGDVILSVCAVRDNFKVGSSPSPLRKKFLATSLDVRSELDIIVDNWY